MLTPCDRVQCLPDNSNSNCHYPVRNLSDPTAETSTCGYPDPTAENATRDYRVRNFFDSIADRSATCGHCVWNLSDSASDHSASARNVSDSTAGCCATRDYSMLNLSESMCLLCPGPGPARSASQDLSCSICPKGLQCSASQDLFASICPKGLQRSASQDLFASICPKDPQCSASQDLFASICPKDPQCSSFSWWESFRVSVESAWFQGWSIDHWESLSLSAASAVSYRLSFSDSSCHSYASWLRSSARGTSLIVKRKIIWKDNKNRAWPDLGSELPSASPIYWFYRGAQLPAKCQHFK